MHYYKVTLQYDGTGYAGFQWQKGIPTIQQDFNQAAAQLMEGKFSTVGCSRTDSGVHASQQVIRLTCEFPLPEKDCLDRLNQQLARQIRCLEIVACSGDFIPSAAATAKEYRYLFTNRTRVTPPERRFVANLAPPLDMGLVEICAAKIRGVHDFRNFCSTGSNVKTTVREVVVCELREIDPRQLFAGSTLFVIPPTLTSCYQLRFEAQGFLKQMIRHLVSALWVVGSKKLSVEDFSVLLAGGEQQKRLWRAAPPNGLHLYKIQF